MVSQQQGAVTSGGNDATHIVEQMMEAFNAMPEELIEGINVRAVAKDPSGQAEARATKVRQLPAIRVFHLNYDNQGNVIDYHQDTWRISTAQAFDRLSRRTSDGLPVWSIRSPEELLHEEFPCRHPECKAGPFRTIEQREMHVMAAHPQWRQQEVERQGRELQEQNLEMQRTTQQALQAQADAIERAMSTMAKTMERLVFALGKEKKNNDDEVDISK